MKSAGSIPSPRSSHATAVSEGNVWLYGGVTNMKQRILDDLYQLDMTSLTWTNIQTVGANPPQQSSCSLSVISEHRLLLHGGFDTTQAQNSTWIFDLPLQSWRKHTRTKYHPRCKHTATTATNSSVIVIGGTCRINTREHVYNDTFIVRLEPRSLQQLAMHTIYQHRDVLPLKLLPKKLKSKFKYRSGYCLK